MLRELGVPTVVVLTKADKLGRGKRSQKQREVQKHLGLPSPPLATSVTEGAGRRELLHAIAGLADSWRDLQQESTDGTQEEDREG